MFTYHSFEKDINLLYILEPKMNVSPSKELFVDYYKLEYPHIWYIPIKR